MARDGSQASPAAPLLRLELHGREDAPPTISDLSDHLGMTEDIAKAVGGLTMLHARGATVFQCADMLSDLCLELQYLVSQASEVAEALCTESGTHGG